MSRRTFSYDLQLVFDRPERRCAGTPRRYLPMPCDPWVIVILSDAAIPNQRGAQQMQATMS